MPESVFSCAPRQDRCCLCESPDVCHMERRPTGKNSEVQTWPYCARCWAECQEPPDADPMQVAVAYLAFLRFLLKYGTFGSISRVREEQPGPRGSLQAGIESRYYLDRMRHCPMLGQYS
jgi:hypothetical protein